MKYIKAYIICVCVCVVYIVTMSNRVFVAVELDSKHSLWNAFRICENRLFMSVIKHLSEMMMMTMNNNNNNSAKRQRKRKHEHQKWSTWKWNAVCVIRLNSRKGILQEWYGMGQRKIEWVKRKQNILRK